MTDLRCRKIYEVYGNMQSLSVNQVGVGISGCGIDFLKSIFQNGIVDSR